MSALPLVWRRALPALVLSLLWLLFWYRETGAAMVAIWARSDTFAHGFIVPPIVLWLIWRKRRLLANLQPRPQWLLAPLIVALAAVWLLGQLAAINVLTQFAFVLLAIAMVVLLLGVPVARRLTFPLAFLLLAVPFGDFMMPQLMEWTARFTVLGLRLSGIPVYQEGLQFIIPSGNWSVVEACSGVRYLIASFTVGALFAYLNYRSLKRRLIFIAVAIAVPVVANWLRAYIIVMLGHLSGNKLAAGVDHLIYGWVFFGVVIMLMFMIGARWADATDDEIGDLVADGKMAGMNTTGKSFWLAALLLAVITVLPHAAQKLIERLESASPPVLFIADGETGAAWKKQDKPQTDWRPAFQNPSAELNTVFSSGENTVGLYLGYYRNQKFDRKLVSSENLLVKYKDTQWAQVGAATTRADFIQPGVTLRTAELRAAGLGGHSDAERLVVWQVYWINGRLTASDPLAKAYTAFSRLLGQGDDSAVIILYAPKTQAGGGEMALQRFASDNASLIAATLRRARAQR